jgi:hypothetical protein
MSMYVNSFRMDSDNLYSENVEGYAVGVFTIRYGLPSMSRGDQL